MFGLTLRDATDLARQMLDFLIVLVVFSGVTHATKRLTEHCKRGRRAVRVLAVVLDCAIIAAAVALRVLSVESLKDAGKELLIERDSAAGEAAIDLAKEEI